MESVDLKFIPVVGRCFLDPLSMFGRIADTSWTQLVQAALMEGLALLQMPTLPHHPPPYTYHPWCYSSCEKVAQNPAVLAS